MQCQNDTETKTTKINAQKKTTQLNKTKCNATPKRTKPKHNNNKKTKHN